MKSLDELAFEMELRRRQVSTEGPHIHLEKPTCYVCKKPVDDLTIEEGPSSPANIMLVAKCHGAEEIVMLDEVLMMQIHLGTCEVPKVSTSGYAFVPKPISLLE